MEPEYENQGASSAHQQGNEPEPDHDRDHHAEAFRAEDVQEVVEDDGYEPMSEDDDDGDGDGDGDDDDDQQPPRRPGGDAPPSSDQIEFHDTSIAAFQGHGEKSLFTLALHPAFPHPPLAVSGGEDDGGWIWSVLDGAPLVRLSGHTDSVVATGFSADGNWVATGGMDGQVRVWKRVGSGSGTAGAGGARSGAAAGSQASAEESIAEAAGSWTFAHSLTGPDEVVWIAWHPSAPILAAGATDSTVWMWNVTRGTHMGTFIGHTDAVTCGSWTPDGRRLVTASEDGSLIVWNPQMQSPLAKLQSGDARFTLPGGVTSLRVAPDSGTVVVGSATGEVRVVNLARADVEGILAVVAALEGHASGESVEAIQFVHLGLVPGAGAGAGGAQQPQQVPPVTGVITGASDGQVHVWELATGKVRTTVSHDDSITSLAIHGTTPWFTTSGMDGAVRTWDARTGELLASHMGFTAGVLTVAVGPDDGLTQGADTGGVGAYARPGHGWKLVAGGDEGVGLVFRY